MTAKEKAFRLYELIRYDVSTLKGTDALINEVAKRCALIAVDLILSEFYADDFYLEVKQEIEKL